MKMSTLETYGLSVCFVAAIALAVALCMLLYTLVQLFIPLFTLDKWDYERHLSNDAFWEHKIGTRLAPQEGELSEKPVRPTEEALTQQRESAFQFLLQTNRHEAAKLLVKVVIFIVVDAVLFGSHWLIARGAHGAS